jgi:hypothetical protein
VVEDEEKLAGYMASAVGMEHRDACMAAAYKEEHMAREAEAHKSAVEAVHTPAAEEERRPVVVGEQNLPHKGLVAAPPHSPTT